MLEVLAIYPLLIAYIQHQLSRKKLITTKEITETYNVSRSVVYRLRDQGLLHVVAKGKSLYFEREEVDDVLGMYRRQTMV
ncbi:helix-turn-helix domain-containing protein [Zhouia sp. PK063]|uniref:helix-turn-helix domain-containing protein n=1 Tax=Zhouia sp. PK063 TaxID=3373602 RepID=UPI00378AD4EA